MRETFRFALVPFLFLASSIAVLPLVLAEPPKDQLESQLKEAVQRSQSKLPNLEAWQKRLFEEEVIPQYQRFIRDYKNSDAGLKVDVDVENLKNYLAFYAPTTLKQTQPQILLLFKTDPGCQKCSESAAGIRKLAQTRLERRGFVIQTVNPNEVPNETTEAALKEKLEALAKKRNAAGALMVRWTLAPVDDLDTAHADEKHYNVSSYLQIKDVFLQSHQNDLLDTDSLEMASARVISEIFTNLGTKVASLQSTENNNDEVLVELTGIKNFEQFTRIKNQIGELFKESSTSVEDRVFSKGKIVLAIITKLKSDEVKKKLAHHSFDANTDSSVKVGVR